ncbi:MAG: putative metal-dependent hydrolase [Bacteroidia bacterium]|nr:putative metal-dependent hydrolase [Bacteroidia bacterium]
MNLEERKYPVGKYQAPEIIDASQRESWMMELDAFPAKFRQLAESLTADQLNSPYREGGWTGRQVIHHVPDSHMNAYLRFRWALTEDNPMIKAYDEQAWAMMTDYQNMDISASLNFLDSLHKKWVQVQSHMDEKDWLRTYRHPEDGKTYRLDQVLGMYVWHGNHHFGHLKIIQQQN